MLWNYCNVNNFIRFSFAQTEFFLRNCVPSKRHRHSRCWCCSYSYYQSTGTINYFIQNYRLLVHTLIHTLKMNGEFIILSRNWNGSSFNRTNLWWNLFNLVLAAFSCCCYCYCYYFFCLFFSNLMAENDVCPHTCANIHSHTHKHTHTHWNHWLKTIKWLQKSRSPFSLMMMRMFTYFGVLCSILFHQFRYVCSFLFSLFSFPFGHAHRD